MLCETEPSVAQQLMVGQASMYTRLCWAHAERDPASSPPPDLRRAVQAGAAPHPGPLRGAGPELRGPEARVGRGAADRHGPDHRLQGPRPGEDER